MSKIHLQLDTSLPTSTKSLKVALVQPYYMNTWEALGLGYIASYARKNYQGKLDLSFFHGNFDSDEIIIAGCAEVDIVGFSCTSPTFAHAVRLTKKIKEINPNVHIVVGGFHVSALRELIFEKDPIIDQIVVGKGESAFLEILNGNRNKVVHGTKTDFNNLPWPDRDLIKNERCVQLCEDMIGQRITSFQSVQVCPLRCLAGDSYILQSDKVIKFDEQEYSSIQSHICNDITHSHYIGKENKQIVFQGMKNCLKVTTDNGLELSLTPEHICHKVCVSSEEIIEIPAKNLKIGDWIPLEINQNKVTDYIQLTIPEKTAIQKSRSYMHDIHYPELNEDVAWLLGYIIGDGCLPADNRPYIQLVISDKVQEKIVDIVKNQFNLEVRINKQSNCDKILSGQIHSRMFVRFLKESLGIGVLEKKLKVPRAIFQSPKSVCESFLKGLWAADGHTNKDVSYLTTVSKTLATEVAYLLMWIGKGSVIRTIKNNNLIKCYRIERHDECCFDRIDGTPCLMCKIPSIYSLTKNRKGCYVKRTQKPGHSSIIRSFLKLSSPNNSLLKDNIIYVKIKNISEDGLKEVYDIYSPETDQKISANGILVHNCRFCSEEAMTGKMNRSTNPLMIRDVNDTLDEIEFVTAKYKLDEFKFVDATWDVSAAYVIEFCKEKLRRNNFVKWEALIHAAFINEEMFYWMAKTNVYQINVGCESGSDKILKDVGKGANREKLKNVFKWAKDAGIRRRGFFLLGMPNETQEDLDLTESLIDEMQPDQVGFTILAPYPNVPGKLYDYEKYKDIDWSNVDEYSNDIWRNIAFSNAELKEKQKYFTERYKHLLCERQEEQTFIRKYQTVLPEHVKENYPGNFAN